GGTSIDHLAVAVGSSGDKTPLIFLGLMLCGFMIKSGLAPFHWWVPDAYQSAPAPISAFLAGIATKAVGVYAIVKIMIITSALYPHDTAQTLGRGVMFFGALSIVVGALAAIYQKDFKRMLAYSSISQVGYIVLAAGAGTPLAIAGAVFHLFNHATFKASLFLNSAAIEQSAGTTDMTKLGGLESRMPWTSWTAVVGAMSTAGIPPLSGFWSKVIIIAALWQANLHGYAFVAVGASILTLAYFLILQRRVFFGKTPQSMAEVKEAPLALIIAPIIFSAIMIALGICFPLIFRAFIAPAARIIL
ncbi:MAG: proton-conducting transporter membrane subunit, partial [Elusimicrobia bacterium]|nr:proton-conducting transporter membrane subunit [Elusimicrobiota bacterium]